MLGEDVPFTDVEFEEDELTGGGDVELEEDELEEDEDDPPLSGGLELDGGGSPYKILLSKRLALGGYVPLTPHTSVYNDRNFVLILVNILSYKSGIHV